MTSASTPERGGFLARWSQRKLQSRVAQPATAPLADPQPAPPAETPQAMAADAAPPPTLEELAALDYTADLTRFVARGVDEGVRRAALRKLFADPHFNVMDGLDVYIDDYNATSTVPPGLLARLKQLYELEHRLDTAASAFPPTSAQLAAAPPPEDATRAAVESGDHSPPPAASPLPDS